MIAISPKPANRPRTSRMRKSTHRILKRYMGGEIPYGNLMPLLGKQEKRLKSQGMGEERIDGEREAFNRKQAWFQRRAPQINAENKRLREISIEIEKSIVEEGRSKHANLETIAGKFRLRLKLGKKILANFLELRPYVPKEEKASIDRDIAGIRKEIKEGEGYLEKLRALRETG